jgi:hypothetical protein
MTAVMPAPSPIEHPAPERGCDMKHRPLSAALFSVLAVLHPRPALAHCDTLDGPVVKDARTALETRDVSPVLKWVAAEEEGAIRLAFTSALAVRALGPEARQLADRFFFETVVRVHRQGEGAPYTGLQPAGTAVEPGIAAADGALASGSADALVALAARDVEQGLRRRHARVVETKEHAGESIARGREYVAAYVEFVHYAEGVLKAAAGPAGHAGREAAAAHVH